MSFEIQRQIKQNAEQMRSYVSDLYEWEQQMDMKQRAKNKILRQERAKEQEIKRQLQKEIQEKKKQVVQESQINKKQAKVDLVRDANTIKDYYSAWDKFDIDREIQKLQEEEKKAFKPYNPYENSLNYIRAKPKAKVNISVKSQRAAVIDPNELKDKGNIHFKVCEYQKAIDAYTQCLQKLNEQDVSEKNNKLKSVVLSNRAMAQMKLNQNSKALRDCTESINYNSKYVKSYLRRAQCHKKLGNYLEGLADYKKIKELDPNDKDVDTQIKKIEKYLQKRYKEARQNLIVQNVQKVIEGSSRIPIEEVEQFEDLSKGKEKPINYLQEL